MDDVVQMEKDDDESSCGFYHRCMTFMVLDKHNCCSTSCATFLVVLGLSITCMIIAILGFTGDHFDKSIPMDFYAGLISLIIGIWIKQPRVKK